VQEQVSRRHMAAIKKLKKIDVKQLELGMPVA